MACGSRLSASRARSFALTSSCGLSLLQWLLLAIVNLAYLNFPDHPTLVGWASCGPCPVERATALLVGIGLQARYPHRGHPKAIPFPYWQRWGLFEIFLIRRGLQI